MRSWRTQSRGRGWLTLRSSIIHLAAAGTMVATALRASRKRQRNETKRWATRRCQPCQPAVFATSVSMVARATVFSAHVRSVFSAHVRSGAGFFATSSAPIIHSVPITGSAGTGGQGEIRKISGQDRRGCPSAPRKQSTIQRPLSKICSGARGIRIRQYAVRGAS